MTMVSSGPISLGGTATSGGLNQSVNVELGRSGTASINMNESAVRTLAGVPSGAISMSNFYGKANQFSFTISTNQSNANLRTLAVNAGWNQSSKVVATISSGVVISSTSTGTPALTIDGSWPGGVELTNAGTIVGRGGTGGTGGSYSFGLPYAGTAGTSGGLGLSVSVAVTITNNGTIGGGGGGGGGGGMSSVPKSGDFGGGGGGGGAGTGPGGAGGTANQGNGSAGSSGTASSGGAGGAGGYFAGTGGTGGSQGSTGASGTAGFANGANGGGGGAGGGAVSGNSNITWLAFGTRNGGIS